MGVTHVFGEQIEDDTILDDDIATTAAIQLSKLGTGNLTLINQGSVIFKELTANGTDSVTLEAPASVTTSYILKLPPAVASAGQVLTDAAGDGVLSWSSAGSGSGTVNSGTAGRLSLYATSTNAVSDTYVQNTKNITLAIAAQATRSQHLVLTIPNPGDAVTVANIVLDQGAYTIAGQLTLSSALLVADGTASAPGYSFTSDSNTGIFRLGTDALNLVTGGQTGLSIDATQAVSIHGTITNNSAAAGYVGEYIESVVSAVNAFGSGSWGDVTSISLTAGDWDVSFNCEFDANGATVTENTIGISTTSGNSSTGLVVGSNRMAGAVPLNAVRNSGATIAVYRMSLSATTTVYAKGRMSYSAATSQFDGRLSARRVR